MAPTLQTSRLSEAAGVSSEKHQAPDWSRENGLGSFFDPAPRMLRAIRRWQKYKNRRGPLGKIICKISTMQNAFWGLLSGCYLPVMARYGGGLLLPHPFGIIIHDDVRIGVNCLIFHQVTIGTSGNSPGVPTIGDHVEIGAGAKVLGGIVVGSRARIGANAVVIKDVPPGAIAVGVPARIISARSGN